MRMANLGQGDQAGRRRCNRSKVNEAQGFMLNAVAILNAVAAAVACVPTTPPCSAVTCAGALDNLPCRYPNATGCAGDFCCLSCSLWRRFLLPSVPSCTCDEYRSGFCFASDCVPCNPACFPHNMSGPPLGMGVLCTNSSATSCEPCCQQQHHDKFCKLECPCDAGVSDCSVGSVTSTLW